MDTPQTKAGKPPKLLQRLQAEQPWCVYCGMTTPGETVDHMPPIAMFDLRQRLKGLEFLACQPCNHGSKGLDQLMSLLTRAYPDADTPEAKAEVRQLFVAIENNFPGVLKELKPTRLQLKRAQRTVPDGAVGTLNLRGPIMRDAIFRFGAKVGMALHYEKTRSILPVSGGVLVTCHTNYDLFRNKMPADVLALVGEPHTLRQGKKSAEEHFGYASTTEDGSLVLHFVTFRLSLSYILFTTSDAQRLIEAPSGNVFRPGCLRPIALGQ